MSPTMAGRTHAIRYYHILKNRNNHNLIRSIRPKSVSSHVGITFDPENSSLTTAVALAAAASLFAGWTHKQYYTAQTEALTSSNHHAISSNDTDDANDWTTILNWSGTHNVKLPPGTYHEPESIAELTELVSQAFRNGTHIRPVGSALSPNGIAFDTRGMVCLSNLDKIIDVNKKDMTVTVQAGARVSQVIEALRPHGLTLPNLASIAEQQIGGFVSVGAHGTGASIPPCDEFVTGLTIITPSEFGTIKMTEETHGSLFHMARLGLGGLGILSEVTLKVVPAHRLVEQTIVMTREEAKRQLRTLLKRHKHVRYMWIPYQDAVVVVTNDDENKLPLLGAGTEVGDGKGGKKKIVTDDDIVQKYSQIEQLAPLRELLQSLLKSNNDVFIDEETIMKMGYGDLRDLILALGNMLDPDHIKRCNKAELEFWVKAQGLRVLPSDQLLQFDCGGQQWVYEVCFPVGTFGLPNSNSTDFVEELLKEIEILSVPAPSPIEQRWTSASTSPLSPASAGLREFESYDSKNALFSWVGVIMYLPSEDKDPTGYRREFITQAFKEKYCKIVEKIGEKYRIMCHWAKLELDESDVRERVRSRLGPIVIYDYNEARKLYDPKGVLSCALLDHIFEP